MTITKRRWRDISGCRCFFDDGRRSLLFHICFLSPASSSAPCAGSGVVDSLRVGHEELSVVGIAEELAFLVPHTFRQGVATDLQLAFAVATPDSINTIGKGQPKEDTTNNTGIKKKLTYIHIYRVIRIPHNHSNLALATKTYLCLQPQYCTSYVCMYIHKCLTSLQFW